MRWIHFLKLFWHVAVSPCRDCGLLMPSCIDMSGWKPSERLPFESEAGVAGMETCVSDGGLLVSGMDSKPVIQLNHN